MKRLRFGIFNYWLPLEGMPEPAPEPVSLLGPPSNVSSRLFEIERRLDEIEKSYLRVDPSAKPGTVGPEGLPGEPPGGAEVGVPGHGETDARHTAFWSCPNCRESRLFRWCAKCGYDSEARLSDSLRSDDSANYDLRRRANVLARSGGISYVSALAAVESVAIAGGLGRVKSVRIFESEDGWMWVVAYEGAAGGCTYLMLPLATDELRARFPNLEPISPIRALEEDAVEATRG